MGSTRIHPEGGPPPEATKSPLSSAQQAVWLSAQKASRRVLGPSKPSVLSHFLSRARVGPSQSQIQLPSDRLIAQVKNPQDITLISKAALLKVTEKEPSLRSKADAIHAVMQQNIQKLAKAIQSEELIPFQASDIQYTISGTTRSVEFVAGKGGIHLVSPSELGAGGFKTFKKIYTVAVGDHPITELGEVVAFARGTAGRCYLGSDIAQLGVSEEKRKEGNYDRLSELEGNQLAARTYSRTPATTQGAYSTTPPIKPGFPQEVPEEIPEGDLSSLYDTTPQIEAELSRSTSTGDSPYSRTPSLTREPSQTQPEEGDSERSYSRTPALTRKSSQAPSQEPPEEGDSGKTYTPVFTGEEPLESEQIALTEPEEVITTRASKPKEVKEWELRKKQALAHEANICMYLLGHIPKDEFVHLCRPILVSTLSSGKKDTGFFYQFIDAPTLEKANATLTTIKKAKAILDIITGVSGLHRCNLVHRDIKPDNILIAEEGAVVIDYGLASHMTDPHLQTDWIQPLEYRAPEGAENSYKKEADVYSIGVLAYMILSNYQEPGSAWETYLEKRKELVKETGDRTAFLPITDFKAIPKEFRSFVKGLLNNNPAKRPTLESASQTLRSLLKKMKYTQMS